MAAPATSHDSKSDASEGRRATKRRSGLVSVVQDDVLEAVGQCTARVWLASPFLSAAVAQAMADRAPKGKPVSRRLLTALTQRSVEAGVLDPGGLAILQTSGWDIRSIPNLHAKAILCDTREALIGSANLTQGGLGGGNLELGSWLPSEDVIGVTSYLKRWWSAAAPVGPVDVQRASRHFPQGARRSTGWVVGRPVKLNKGTKLKAARRLRRPEARKLWLKAVYHEGRNAPPDWWVHQPWINDAHGRTTDGKIRHARTGEPARKPGYQLGDFIVLYLVGPSVLPAIYEVVSLPHFDVDFVRAHWPDDAGTYGWVTDVDLVLRADIAKAPRLSALGITGQALQGGKKRLSVSQFAHVRELIEAAG